MMGDLTNGSCSDIVEDGTGQQRPGASLAPCHDLVDAVQLTAPTPHIT